MSHKLKLACCFLLLATTVAKAATMEPHLPLTAIDIGAQWLPIQTSGSLPQLMQQASINDENNKLDHKEIDVGHHLYLLGGDPMESLVAMPSPGFQWLPIDKQNQQHRNQNIYANNNAPSVAVAIEELNAGNDLRLAAKQHQQLEPRNTNAPPKGNFKSLAGTEVMQARSSYSLAAATDMTKDTKRLQAADYEPDDAIESASLRAQFHRLLKNLRFSANEQRSRQSNGIKMPRDTVLAARQRSMAPSTQSISIHKQPMILPMISPNQQQQLLALPHKILMMRDVDSRNHAETVANMENNSNIYKEHGHRLRSRADAVAATGLPTAAAAAAAVSTVSNSLQTALNPRRRPFSSLLASASNRPQASAGVSAAGRALAKRLRELSTTIDLGRLARKADWKGLTVKLLKVFMQYFLDLMLNDMFGTTGKWVFEKKLCLPST